MALSCTKNRHVLARCRPLGDRIVIKVAKAPSMSKGGIALPDSVRESKRPCQGIVVAVGPGKKLDELVEAEWSRPLDGPAEATGYTAKRLSMDVNIGDTVLFAQFAGMSLQDSMSEDPDNDYIIIREEDVIATLDADEGEKDGE
jgi:chaperonin GroES